MLDFMIFKKIFKSSLRFLTRLTVKICLIEGELKLSEGLRRTLFSRSLSLNKVKNLFFQEKDARGLVKGTNLSAKKLY